MAACGCRGQRAPVRGGQRAPVRGFYPASRDGYDDDELILFADNDGNLYRQMFQPIWANLLRKMKAGTYSTTPPWP